MADTLLNILRLSTEYLASKGIESARLEAEYLLCDVLNCERIDLYTQFDRPLTEEELESYRTRLKRRSAGEPLQLILGYAEFYGIRLKMRRGVFIPRPETELIVDLARDNLPGSGYFKRTLDLGCGSGAIGLALLEEGLTREVTAVDLDINAIALSLENALGLGFKQVSRDREKIHLARKQHDVEQSCLLIHGDGFNGSALEGLPGFDLVVSNPPYICQGDSDSLPADVRNYDPPAALFSGEDGLDHHKKLAGIVPSILIPDGLFLAEFGDGQEESVLQIHGKWCDNVRTIPDLNRRQRVILASKKNNKNDDNES